MRGWRSVVRICVHADGENSREYRNMIDDLIFAGMKRRGVRWAVGVDVHVSRGGSRQDEDLRAALRGAGGRQARVAHRHALKRSRRW